MKKNDFFVALCRREKACSIRRAMSLVEESGYDPEVVKVVIERKDCSFHYLWELLGKTEDILWVIKSAVQNDNFRKISYNQFLSLFVTAKKQRSDYSEYASEALEILAEKKFLNKFTGEELLNFSKEFGYNSSVINNLGRKDYWTKMKKDLALEILKETTIGSCCNNCLAKIFISRKDCSIQEALIILRRSSFPMDVSSAVIKRKDFKLSDVLSGLRKIFVHNVKGYSFNDIIIQNFEKIIARSDCSLNLAYELLEIVREESKEIGREYLVLAVSGLIKRNDLPFDKAFALMEEIECRRDAFASFEERRDFDIPKRIRLLGLMSSLIPIIYDRGDEPEFYDGDSKKIVEKGDWINLPLGDALRFCKNSGSFYGALEIVFEREDWKSLSLSQAIKLASETGNQNYVLERIITTKNCSLGKALELAELRRGDNSLYNYSLANVIIESGIASIDESLQILKKSDNFMSTAISIAERKDTPLRVIVDLLAETNYELINLWSIINKHDDWRIISLKDAFDFLSNPVSYLNVLSVITEREDWRKLSFQEAMDFLNKIDWSRNPWPVVWSLTEKKDCPLELALKFLGLLDPTDQNIQKALLPVVNRLDNPLENALELAKNSYFGSFKGISTRKDWKELPLSQVYYYIEKYSADALIDSLAERDDWRALTVEEAEKEFLSQNSYSRLLYLGLIVRQETISLEEALVILKKNDYNTVIAREFIQRSDCPLDLLSDVFKKSDRSALIFLAIEDNKEWKKLLLEEAFSFAEKTSSGLFFLITKREDWKAISLAKSLRFAKKYNYDKRIIEAITSREDWKKK
ncbi:MAG: hypothetical protein WC928_01705 [Patescibacteria group bacterium]|jgi:hypothetical protein